MKEQGLRFSPYRMGDYWRRYSGSKLSQERVILKLIYLPNLSSIYCTCPISIPLTACLLLLQPPNWQRNTIVERNLWSRSLSKSNGLRRSILPDLKGTIVILLVSIFSQITFCFLASTVLNIFFQL